MLLTFLRMFLPQPVASCSDVFLFGQFLSLTARAGVIVRPVPPVPLHAPLNVPLHAPPCGAYGDRRAACTHLDGSPS